MYYFETVRWNIPLFWKENGLPVFVEERRLSRRKLVWWMPTNWIAVSVILMLMPFWAVSDWFFVKGAFEGGRRL